MFASEDEVLSRLIGRADWAGVPTPGPLFRPDTSAGASVEGAAE